MLSCLLTNLKDEEYTQKGKHITSIGAHVRHTIEYLQILINTDLKIPVDYAKRDRHPTIENNREYAVNELLSLKNRLYKTDRELIVASTYSSSLCFAQDRIRFDIKH